MGKLTRGDACRWDDIFIKHCENMDIQYDTFFILGEGSPNDPNRFNFTCALSRRKPSNSYAVFYYKRDKLYVAWNLKAPKAERKTCFSLSKKRINECMLIPDFFGVSKNIEYSGWNEETVFVLSENGIDEFLNYVCHHK